MDNIFQAGKTLEQRLVQLEDTLENQVNKVIDISHIGTAFTSTLNLDMVLPMVIETGLKLVNGEVGEVLVFDFNGDQKSVSWGLTTQIVNSIKTRSIKNPIDRVRKNGNTLMLNNLDHKLSRGDGNLAIKINSLLVVPLKSQDDIIGVISIANKEDGEEFNSDDQFSLEIIGSFAAVAVRNAELHHEALAKQKLEQELQLAEHVQNTLMPAKLIEYEKLNVYAYYNTAGQVGGDFYDVIDLGQGRYLLVVADVSSKGVPAALIMTSTRSYVRVIAEKMTSLAELVRQVNSYLCHDIEKLGGMFVTMFFGLVDTENGKLYSVNAGHPPGLILNEHKAEMLKMGGTFIGQFPDLEFREKESALEAGDRLIVFTDGIFECVNSHGEMLGLENALDFFKQRQALNWDKLSSDLRQLLKEYSFDKGRVDDTTLLMGEMKL